MFCMLFVEVIRALPVKCIVLPHMLIDALCRFKMLSYALHAAMFVTCMASQVHADCADDMYRWHV